MNRKCGLISRLFLFCVLPGIFFPGTSGAAVSLEEFYIRGGNAGDREKYNAQDIRFWGSGVYPGEPSFSGRLFKMRTGTTYYALWFPGTFDKDSEEWKSSVGMPKPSTANWFSTGFYNVIINGKPAVDYRADVEAESCGDRALVKARWHHPDALVTAEFLLLAGDDKIVITTTVSPVKKISGYRVELTAYPSSFGGGYREGIQARDRQAATAGRILSRPEAGGLNTILDEKEPWVLFYDRHFDVAENRGEGPCAALFSPREAVGARALITNYQCLLRIDYPAEENPVSSSIAVWDFRGMTNREAMDYMNALTIVHEDGS